MLSSVVQEITYSKEHGAPCPHKKYDNERKKEQLDRLKPILVITEVEVGSDMYRQGYRWTQYINSNSWQKAPIHMVRTPLKIVKLPYPPSRLLCSQICYFCVEIIFCDLDHLALANLNGIIQVLGQRVLSHQDDSCCRGLRTNNKVRKNSDVKQIHLFDLGV